MTIAQYILTEKRIIEKECRHKGISPDEWISTNAVAYHKKHADYITLNHKAERGEGFYIINKKMKGGE